MQIYISINIYNYRMVPKQKFISPIKYYTEYYILYILPIMYLHFMYMRFMLFLLF